MGRLVTAKPRGAESFADKDKDDYLERVVKYIPAEIVAAYVAVQNILDTQGCKVPQSWWYGLYLIFVVLTPAYLYTRRTKGEPYMLHLAIATAAFVIWSYALTNCAKFGVFSLEMYDAKLAAVALIMFSLIAGILQPKPL